ncbi:MAG: hypothetical protein BMS9Abin14_287 [Gammaproteobacteria bacterium]|nr:MAG: hypothetical protein BMS9Abin14_287 [Gammaproteobacteria bacterium]
MPKTNNGRDIEALRGKVQHRTITIGEGDRAQHVDPESRTVDLAFSSEEPVMRFGDIEILDHAPASVRMDRLNDGAAFLLGHGGARDQIGVIDAARIDDDKVGRAVARFGNGPLANEIMADVNDGIRRLVSVGYIVHQWVVTQNDNAPWEFRATDWEPVELSIVPVPADASVGVGRDIHSNQEIDDMPTKATQAPEARNEGAAQDVQGGEVKKPAEDKRTDDQVLAAEARAQECADMRKLGKQFDHEEQAEQLIATDGTTDDLKRAIRNEIVNRKPEPVPSALDIRITGGMRRYKALRAFKAQGEEAAYRSGMWARAALFGDDTARRWIAEHGVRQGVEGVFAQGGAIVPDEMSQAIIDLRETFGIARSAVRVVPMASDTMLIPRRTGGVTAEFVGENTEPTASNKTWDQVQLTAKKLGAQCKFSSEYAEDAIIDVAEDLANEIAYAFAEKEDDTLFNGDGTSSYGGIVGIRVKIIDGNHGAGAVDAASGTNTYAEVAQADLESIMAPLPQYAEGDARWYVSQPGKTLVFDALAAAAGGTTMMMLGDRPQPAYLGYPITISQKMSTSTGDLENVAMILFGDMMKAVTMGDRRGFRVRLLEERYAELDQLAVVAFERFDIVVHDLGDGTTAGPIVALIGN